MKLKILLLIFFINIHQSSYASVVQAMRSTFIWAGVGCLAQTFWGGLDSLCTGNKGDLLQYVTLHETSKKLTLWKAAGSGALSGLGGFGVYYFKDYIKEYTPFGCGSYVTWPLAVCFTYLSSLGAAYLLRPDVMNQEFSTRQALSIHLIIALRGCVCSLAGLTVVELPELIKKLSRLAAWTQQYINGGKAGPSA